MEIHKLEKKNTAVIDIGTNSTRLLIFRTDEKDKLIRVNKSVRYTRMGQGVNRTGELHTDALKRNFEALEEYKNIAKDYAVENFYVFGTSAMRDASNAQKFIKQVQEKIGLTIEVISGETEAKLGFMGVSQCFDEKILIFDIGGGSTEFILGEGSQLLKTLSLNMGCVRCTEDYLFSDPPTFQEIERLNTDVYAEFLKKVKNLIPSKPYKLIGIGGTATSLSTIKQKLKIYNSEKVHGSEISKRELEKIIDVLTKKNIQERQKMVGLEAKRADVILAGAVILFNVLKLTQENSFLVCDYDNLEGAAYRYFIEKTNENN